MTLPPLSNRLSSAIPFVREGCFFADVGTDHAYLPIYLYQTGHIRGAVASDIGKGPLAIAKTNIKAFGLECHIDTCLSDGLLKLAPYAPEDIAIFGMGGELIASILAAVPWTKDKELRLILQPMTKTETLRAYLLSEGFQILDEVLTKDEGRIYQTIHAAYDGQTRTLSPLELLVGKRNLERGGELLSELLSRHQKTFAEIKSAKEKSNISVTYETNIIEEIKTYRKERSL